MTADSFRDAVEDIVDQDLIHVRGSDGAIVWDSRIPLLFPDLDVDAFTQCVADNVYNDVEIDWTAAEADYKGMKCLTG